MAVATKIDVRAGGAARGTVVGAIASSGLPEHLASVAAGPFGHRSWSLALLEGLADAADLGLAAAEALRGVVLEDLSAGSRGRGAASFALPALGPEHRQLLATFALVVTADALSSRAESICALPTVSGRLELDGLAELLRADLAPEDLLRRVLRLARAYAERAPAGADRASALGPVVAFFLLLRAAAIELARTSALRPLVAALARLEVTVAGRRYRGLEAEAAGGREPSGLLPVTVDDIVGNAEYLKAGLRLARDVAGYDLATRRNPKRFSPVLFGLGRPGSGKTVTAHAIGAYFLGYCEKRGVPARFHVVRRTDWASSYQNASALNLVRFFREEVQAAEGVCGVYWPDIDTAFASRESSELRQEEKQNLGAVFGVFDGTLLPRDGKWFLICDANTLHMDEATISRIAQSPFRVEGPQTTADYVRLMRGVLLRDVARFLPDDDAAWDRLGGLARELGLSGRHVESVCGAVRAHVQDFDYPDEYFAPGATGEDRERIVAGLGHPAGETRIEELLRSFAAFRRDADDAAERGRFEGEVERIVRHLNASREAAGRIACAELDDQPARSQPAGSGGSSGDDAA
jgi:hypothetical protein